MPSTDLDYSDALFRCVFFVGIALAFIKLLLVPETNDDTECLPHYRSANCTVILYTEDAGIQYAHNLGRKTEVNAVASMRYSIAMG